MKILQGTFKRLGKLYEAMKTEIEAIDDLGLDSFHNPAYYKLLEAVGVNNTHLQAIKHGKDVH